MDPDLSTFHRNFPRKPRNVGISSQLIRRDRGPPSHQAADSSSCIHLYRSDAWWLASLSVTSIPIFSLKSFDPHCLVTWTTPEPFKLGSLEAVEFPIFEIYLPFYLNWESPSIFPLRPWKKLIFRCFPFSRFKVDCWKRFAHTEFRTIIEHCPGGGLNDQTDPLDIRLSEALVWWRLPPYERKFKRRRSAGLCSVLRMCCIFSSFDAIRTDPCAEHTFSEDDSLN